MWIRWGLGVNLGLPGASIFFADGSGRQEMCTFEWRRVLFATPEGTASYSDIQAAAGGSDRLVGSASLQYNLVGRIVIYIAPFGWFNLTSWISQHLCQRGSPEFPSLPALTP